MNNETPIIIWLLLTLFIGLKLTDQINWSWWFVASPVWGYFLLTAIVGFIKGFTIAFKRGYRRTRDHRREGRINP